MRQVAFVHVAVARHLELQRVKAVLRPTVGPGDIATLETAVIDMAEAVAGRQNAVGKLAKLRRAAAAIVAAEIEIGQPALEKPRHFGGTAVAAEQDGIAMTRMDRTQKIGRANV